MILGLLLYVGLLWTDLKGIVIDENGSPVSYAIIRSGDSYSVANESGEFVLNGVSEGSTLLVSCVGFETVSYRVNRIDEMIRISLRYQPLLLKEVTVMPSDPNKIMEAVVGKIFEGQIYSRGVFHYEYGQYIRANSDVKTYTKKDFMLIEKKIKGTRVFPEFRFLTAVSDSSNWETAYFERFYQPKYLYETIKFFEQLSHNPDFLDPNYFSKYKFELLDETADLYKIAVFSKSAKLKYNGEVWVNKLDFGVRHLTYWENDRFLKSENLKLALMVKPTSIKSLKLKGTTYDFWTDRDEYGTYFVKTVRVNFLLDQELKNGNNASFQVETKMNAVKRRTTFDPTQKYYLPADIFGKSHTVENSPEYQDYRFVLLFDAN